jgi:hypothetical protein
MRFPSGPKKTTSDHAGNPWGAGTLGQLQQRRSAQDDPHLLNSAAQQVGEFLLALLGDFDAQRWTAHTHIMGHNISK